MSAIRLLSGKSRHGLWPLGSAGDLFLHQSNATTAAQRSGGRDFAIHCFTRTTRNNQNAVNATRTRKPIYLIS